MARAKRTKEEILKEIDEGGLEVKMGHPLGPQGVLMSEEDEKSVDELGRPVITGLLWSKAKTGIYLNLFGTLEPDYAGPELLVGGDTIHMGNLSVTAWTTLGVPKASCDGVGASLELPSDLARDELKKDYLTAWIKTTAMEILHEAVVNRWGGLKSPAAFEKWLFMSCEDAIKRTGL